MEKKTVVLEIPADKKVEWQEFDGKMVAVLVDDKDERPVTERIKTFEDACKEVGIDAKKWLEEHKDDDVNLLAFLKIRIIVEALNEGWKPKFDGEVYRYAPYFYHFTKEDVDNMDEDEKSRLLFVGGDAYDGSICGLSASNAYHGFSLSYANIGARLALKSKDLALYCGNQFYEIWIDFLFK